MTLRWLSVLQLLQCASVWPPSCKLESTNIFSGSRMQCKTKWLLANFKLIYAVLPKQKRHLNWALCKYRRRDSKSANLLLRLSMEKLLERTPKATSLSTEMQRPHLSSIIQTRKMQPLSIRATRKEWIACTIPVSNAPFPANSLQAALLKSPSRSANCSANGFRYASGTRTHIG